MASEEQQVDYLEEGDYFVYMSDSEESQDADIEMEDASQDASQKSQILNFSGAQSAFSLYKGSSAQSEKLFSDDEKADKTILEYVSSEFNQVV